MVLVLQYLGCAPGTSNNLLHDLELNSQRLFLFSASEIGVMIHGQCYQEVLEMLSSRKRLGLIFQKRANLCCGKPLAFCLWYIVFFF